jgi:hypothetical protein
VSDLVKFTIPPGFALRRVLPTEAELAYGFLHDWIGLSGAVEIARARIDSGSGASSALEKLAVLDDDDVVAGASLLTSMAGKPVPNDAWRIWLFLSLAWVFEHRETLHDPLGLVEMLYADFDYPREVASFVRYMPPPPGEDVGVEALCHRWSDYLEQQGAQLSARQLSS